MTKEQLEGAWRVLTGLIIITGGFVLGVLTAPGVETWFRVVVAVLWTPFIIIQFRDLWRGVPDV